MDAKVLAEGIVTAIKRALEQPKKDIKAVEERATALEARVLELEASLAAREVPR
jgi:hypothetical protein